jgi:hypothetical protein
MNQRSRHVGCKTRVSGASVLVRRTRRRFSMMLFLAALFLWMPVTSWAVCSPPVYHGCDGYNVDCDPGCQYSESYWEQECNGSYYFYSAGCCECA